MKDAAQTLSWVTRAAFGSPWMKKRMCSGFKIICEGKPKSIFYEAHSMLHTCGPRGVNIKSGTSKGDIWPQVGWQSLVWGLGDVVWEGMDALDAALLWEQVHRDALLPQHRQHLLQCALQLCKDRWAFSSCNIFPLSNSARGGLFYIPELFIYSGANSSNTELQEVIGFALYAILV